MLAIALVGLLTPLASFGALAQAELYPGATALVANTGGEGVLLRETPSFEAAVLASFAEGTPADILEGPIYDANGTAWSGVAIGGLTGYIVAGYLAESGQMAPVELAQEAVAAPVAEALPAPAASEATLATSPVATADLNLRAGPSYDDAVLLVIPSGAPVTLTGEWSEAFAGATYNGAYGWVDSNWLNSEAAPAPAEAALLQEAAPVADAAADVAGLVVDPASAPAGEPAYAVDVANLRAGPSANDEVLRVLPVGGAVTITGAASEGWTPVWYNGTWGYISADLLAAGAAPVALAQDAATLETFTTEAPAASGGLQATPLYDINLRAGPSYNDAVLLVIPAGVTVETLAGPEQGFYQVQYGDQVGWLAADYLEVTASYLQRGNRDRQKGKVEGSEPAGEANYGGGIIWPVSGGLWYVMQGYNGSSHQNQDGLWQYQYSLDLARRDGNTAGQQIISPVNGVVRWTDPGSGGISIDMGNGHAVAMFHVAFMSGLEAGTSVRQGQYLGEISGPGGPGFAGTPHVHFTLWTSDDEGNWDRQAVPFTGQYAISGMDFPGGGGGNLHGGTEFSP